MEQKHSKAARDTPTKMKDGTPGGLLRLRLYERRCHDNRFASSAVVPVLFLSFFLWSQLREFALSVPNQGATGTGYRWRGTGSGHYYM